MQVNSLGLTEAQPENNVQRIVLEALGVTLSKSARARSLQLPAWNEALGLPRPWDQQWSLRIKQVLAFETDLLEYDDIFDGSHVIEARTAELVESAQAELDEILALGGAFEAIDEMKGRLVRSHTERMRRIESGDQMVIGVNAFTETAESPLGGEDNILKVDPAVQAAAIAELAEWRTERDKDAVDAALDELERVARTDENIMAATIALAHAGGTTGEWAGRLREVFGEYRAPTGVGAASGVGGSAGLARVGRPAQGRCPAARRASWSPSPASTATPTAPSRSPWRPATPAWRSSTRASASPPSRSPPRPATRTSTSSACRSCPAATSSSCPRSSDCSAPRASTAPVIAGGIIPEDDRPKLIAAGVAAVFTPKDFELTRLMNTVADLAIAGRGD